MAKIIVSFGHNVDMANKIRLILLLLLLSILPQHAFAVKDYVVERAFFEDKTGQLNFDQAKNATYERMGPMLSKGYSASVFWVRLKIEGGLLPPQSILHKTDNQVVLRIQPTYLDDIRLFDPTDGAVGNRVVGDRYAWSNNEYQSLNFNYVINKTEEDRYIWLRIQTTSTTIVQAQALSFEDCVYLDRIQEFGYAFYLAILILLFLLPLLIWITRKELLAGIFAIKQFGAITVLVFHSGYLRLFLPHFNLDVLQFIFNLNLITYSLITILFHYIFLSEYEMKRWAKIFFITMMAAFLVELLLLVLSMDRYALHVNMFVLNLMVLSFLIIPVIGIDWKKSRDAVFSKAWLIAIHVVIFLCGILTTLPSLGYFQGNNLSPVAGMAYGGITGIIFFLVLQYRYRLAREQSIARVSKAEAYANSEKVRREQQGQFLAMLTHELKTPLSIMKMGYTSPTQSDLTKKHIQTAIQDMTDVIDRCLIDDKLQNHEFQLKIQKCNLNELIGEKINQYQDSTRISFASSEVHFIETDVQLLKIIIGNLVDNALKYGEEQSLVEIRVSKSANSDQIELVIENRVGKSGFPDVEKIFDKYYRSPKAYEKTGSGLGLYLVKNFVQLISGEIACITRDQLIVFKVNLPLKTK
jgi:signal transduction histidine kinase